FHRSTAPWRALGAHRQRPRRATRGRRRVRRHDLRRCHDNAGIAEGAGGFENRSRRWKSRGPVLMELLLYRPTVVGLAVLGALLAVAASLLRAAGKLNEVQAKRLNVVAYVVMGASMLLFALAGLRGVPA